MLEELLVDRVVARDDQDVVVRAKPAELALDLDGVERVDKPSGPRGLFGERAGLAVVAHDDREAELRQVGAKRACDVTAAEQHDALGGADPFDERAVVHRRAIRAWITVGRLADDQWYAVERGDEHERETCTGESNDRVARRCGRCNRDFHRAAATHREVADEMLTDDPWCGTRRDFSGRRDDERFDPSAADRAPLLTVGSDGHPCAEVARRRAACPGDCRDRDTASAVERSKRGSEHVDGHA